jgi:PBP1b-binding outer membrane lipoprotein LpoB
MINRLFCCGLLALLAACGSTIDQRVDADAADQVGGTGLQSQDIRTISDRISRDIVASSVLTAAQPGERISFYLINMENEGSDVINKRIILEKIETDLYKALTGRVQILDRTAVGLDAVRREREAKRSGAVAGKLSMKDSVAGADYALTGVIQDRVQQSGKLKSVYYLVTFRLLNLETDEIVWKGDYETKFLSEKATQDR